MYLCTSEWRTFILNLIFVRHAETTLNKSGIFCGRTDCDVTLEGLKQAKNLLKDNEKDFDFIYISPLKRTRQTLDVILPNSNPIIDERIIEAYLGEWEGKNKSSVDQNLLALYRVGKYTPLGAETPEDVDRRVCSFIKSLFGKYQSNQRILIVTHNGVMKSIKRNFVKDYGNIMSKNLETITITDTEFEYYLQSKKSQGTT